MKQHFLGPLFLLLSFSLTACGGGGGNGPTAPETPQTPTVQSQLLLNAAVISLDGGLEEASFLFDGREVFRPVCNPASACQMTATLSGVARGAHTVSIKVIRQNRTTVTYTVVGQVDFMDSAGSRTIPLESRRVVLRADETTTYSISI
jgi:hypothetical protein